LVLELLEQRRLCTYAITDLGTFGGTLSFGHGVNNQGEAVGSAYLDCNCQARTFLWGNGVLHQLDSVGAVKINNQGQVIGLGFDGHPFRWSRQEGMIDLGFAGQANGINNKGEVVGQISGLSHAFLWSNGTTLDLGSFGGGHISTAGGINNETQVVGQATPAVGAPHAFLWTADRGMTDLGSLDGDPGSTSGAEAINDAGQIVGASYSSVLHTTHAAYFSRNGVVDLGTIGAFAIAHAVNNLGQIVGESGDAFITDLYGGPMIDLNTLIPPGTGWSLFEADDINDAGQIVGTGQLPGYDNIHAYLLTPDTAPSVAVLAPAPITADVFASLPVTPFAGDRLVQPTAPPTSAIAEAPAGTTKPTEAAETALTLAEKATVSDLVFAAPQLNLTGIGTGWESGV
jgi:probable HAF family extracellular repeat protein